MESCLMDIIIEHLNKYRLIMDSQHGFTSKRGCLTNLLVFLKTVTDYIDKGYPVDALYLDFQKAFDKVLHCRLIARLKSLGIDCKIASWIRSWLNGRQQRVIINGSVSDWSLVKSSFPQGSVLGPLLFIIFINYLDDGISGIILTFADNTKSMGKVRRVDEFEKLRGDLKTLGAWSKAWQMFSMQTSIRY